MIILVYFLLVVWIVELLAFFAGYVWFLQKTGNDHPLSEDEIKARLGETWHP